LSDKRTRGLFVPTTPQLIYKQITDGDANHLGPVRIHRTLDELIHSLNVRLGQANCDYFHSPSISTVTDMLMNSCHSPMTTVVILASTNHIYQDAERKQAALL